MRKSKCKSVCRTGKFNTISTGDENQGTARGSKKRGSYAELQGEETGAAKPDTLKMARLIVTQLSPLYNLRCRYFY